VRNIEKTGVEDGLDTPHSLGKRVKKEKTPTKKKKSMTRKSSSRKSKRRKMPRQPGSKGGGTINTVD